MPGSAQGCWLALSVITSNNIRKVAEIKRCARSRVCFTLQSLWPVAGDIGSCRVHVGNHAALARRGDQTGRTRVARSAGLAQRWAGMASAALQPALVRSCSGVGCEGVCITVVVRAAHRSAVIWRRIGPSQGGG